MKSLGLISILFYGCSLIYLLHKWPADKTKTYSQNVAREKTTIVYYAAVFVVFLSLLGAFMEGWFFPILQVPPVAQYAFWIGAITQLIAVAVPEIEGPKKTIHLLAAGTMTLSVLLFTMLLAVNPNISSSSKLVTTAAAIFMSLSCLAVVLFQKAREHALALQSSYFFVFFITIITVTYTVK